MCLRHVRIVCTVNCFCENWKNLTLASGIIKVIWSQCE